MAQHIETVDGRLARIEEVLRHTATKAELHALETRLTRWMIGLMVGATAIAATIAGVIVRLVS